MSTVFSKNLRKARTAHDWTRKKSANLIGIKLGTFGAYEEGRAYPPIDVFAKICNVFSITDIIGFIQEEKFDLNNQRVQSIPPTIVQERYNKLRGPAKKAVNVLLGIE